MRARVNPQTTEQVATFDTNLYSIPDCAIVALGVSFYKDTSGSTPRVLAQKEYTEDHLSAFVNMANQLIDSGKCTHFFTIVADTLAASRYGDKDIAPYTTAGKNYLSNNQALFDFGHQQENFCLHTCWEDWYYSNDDNVSDQALVKPNAIMNILQTFKPNLPLLRTSRELRSDSEPAPASPTIAAGSADRHKSLPANLRRKGSFEECVGAKPFSLKQEADLDDYKSIFDNKSMLARQKPIDRLVPSFEVAIKYIKYMFEDQRCPYHRGFIKAVEIEHNKRLADRLGKLARDQKGELTTSNESTQTAKAIESQKIHDFMLNECAHHLVLGIIARKLRVPIRIFHKDGFNVAMVFIENRIIGQLLDSGYTALKGVDLKFVEKKNKKRWFEGRDNFFRPAPSPRRHSKVTFPVPRSPQTKKLVPPAEFLIDATLFLIKPESRRVVEKLLRVLNKTIESKTPLSSVGSSPDSQEQSPRVYALSDEPTSEEVVAALLRYFADPQTPAHVLQDFRESLLSQLSYTPTPAPISTPSSLRSSPEDSQEDSYSSGEQTL